MVAFMKPVIQFLSDEEVKLLHDQSLQILKEKRKDVTLYGRDPKHDVTFEKHEPALAG